MKSGGEVRVWVYGTECELRPVSGLGFLSARREAKQIGREYGDDAAANALISAACLAAQGLYADGERLFETGNDALDAMTAEEILTVAEEYEELSLSNIELSSTPAEDAKIPGMTVLADAVSEAEKKKENAVQNLAQYAEKSDNLPHRRTEDAAVSENTEIDEQKKQEDTADREKNEENGHGYRESGKLVFGEKKTVSRENAQAKKITVRYSGRNTMESVSNFFERDCRRYDGAFKRY